MQQEQFIKQLAWDLYMSQKGGGIQGDQMLVPGAIQGLGFLSAWPFCQTMARLPTRK